MQIKKYKKNCATALKRSLLNLFEDHILLCLHSSVKISSVTRGLSQVEEEASLAKGPTDRPSGMR